MGTVADAVRAAVELLRAAGVRAVWDPADAHPPVVLVRPTGAAPHAAAGCWTVDLDVVVVPAGPAADPLEPWDDRLDVVLDVLGADEVSVSLDPDGVEQVTVRAQVTT